MYLLCPNRKIFGNFLCTFHYFRQENRKWVLRFEFGEVQNVEMVEFKLVTILWCSFSCGFVGMTTMAIFIINQIIVTFIVVFR